MKQNLATMTIALGLFSLDPWLPQLLRSSCISCSALRRSYCPAQSLTETVNPQQTAIKATYLVVYRPGSAWLTGKSVMEQPLKEHEKYMLSLYIKGSMRLAGPLTDNAGGAVLLEVSDEAEAKAIVASDPAVKSGIFVYEMHPWKLQPWEEFAKKAKGRHAMNRSTGHEFMKQFKEQHV
ncbi:MAG: YciI family protein [Candidatus Udaeobacter sp.]